MSRETEHKPERHARGFTSWGQFVAMLFCQLGRAHSLREICGGLACCEGKQKHLGIPLAPKRSTLACANEHRPWPLFETIFQQLLQRARQAVYAQGGPRKFLVCENRWMGEVCPVVSISRPRLLG